MLLNEQQMWKVFEFQAQVETVVDLGEFVAEV